MKLKGSFLFILSVVCSFAYSQGIMTDDGITKTESQTGRQSTLGNIPGRKVTSLNGKWNVIIDPYDFGIGS